VRLGRLGRRPETNRRKGTDLARQALDVAENDPRILANAALVFCEDIGTMIGLVDRASPAAGI
jgi:hypothetical protein